jgi:hypothetical protein
MNKTYAEKLNFFEWGRQDALILFKQLPALLGIDYGKNKYQITLKFIQNLTKILSKKEIRYLEINYTSRKELILSIENLYEKFVNFEEKKIKSSMHLSKCWRITNGESGYRLLLRSSN